MSTQTTLAAPVRKGRHLAPNYIKQGLPDPRPVTDYTVSPSTVAGNLRVTVALAQPCAVRTPAWAFMSVTDGAVVFAPSVVVVDNRTFYFQFVGDPGASVAFIQAPYQDIQVQNPQGGFVRPGATWFRKPA